eukprot:TRINITY_DN23212_c0_g2_i3.p1 TRINITY_DN23212_c0_g2~~TRINITY_DN23212_c0_g2_i3.p1  ORF type:complete len:457 (-),score=66.81 TRINITY_DN23212_c0_g2_i3:894-2237(-)
MSTIESYCTVLVYFIGSPPEADVKFIDAQGVNVNFSPVELEDLEVSKKISKDTHNLEEIYGQQAREFRELEKLMEQIEEDDEDDNNANDQSSQLQSAKIIEPQGDLLDDFVISATTADQHEIYEQYEGNDNHSQNMPTLQTVDTDSSDVVSTRSRLTAVTSINLNSEALSGSQYMQEVSLEKFQKLMDEYERDGDFEGLENIIEEDEHADYGVDFDDQEYQYSENIDQLEQAMNELILNKKGALHESLQDEVIDASHTTLYLANQDDQIKQKVLDSIGVEGDSNRAGVDEPADDYKDGNDNKNIQENELQTRWFETKLAPGTKWDCESIASARSSTRFQASILSAPPKSKSGKKVCQNFAQIPAGILDKLRQSEGEDTDNVSTTSKQNYIRRTDETPEEKKARKAAVKAERRESRAAKKDLKKMFSQERVTQQRHHASMGVQAKVVL